jgi:hypothetical protein
LVTSSPEVSTPTCGRTDRGKRLPLETLVALTAIADEMASYRETHLAE